MPGRTPYASNITAASGGTGYYIEWIGNNYGGGGGGAGQTSNTTGGGGAGGGGDGGATNTSGTPGTDGRGGGGGGAGGTGNGGDGGDGVVILRVPDGSWSPTIGGGLTYSSDSASQPGYTIYTFTAGSDPISWSN